MSFAAYKRKIEAKELELKRLYEERDRKNKKILREGHSDNWDRTVESEKLASGQLEEEVENLSEDQDRKILNQNEHQKRLEEAMPKGEAMGLDYDEPEETTKEQDLKILREGSPQHKSNFQKMEEAEEKRQDLLIKSEQRDLSGEIETDKEILEGKTEKVEESPPGKKSSWVESKSGSILAVDIFDDSILEADTEKPYLFSGNIVVAEEESKNERRFYPLKAVEGAYERLKEKLENEEIVSIMMGHPGPLSSDPSKTVGKLTEVSLTDGELDFVGQIAQETENGKNCAKLLDGHYIEDLSLRASGETFKNSKGQSEVEDFDVDGVDLVISGALGSKVKEILN